MIRDKLRAASVAISRRTRLRRLAIDGRGARSLFSSVSFEPSNQS
jgi:hypothetical protein